MGTEITGSSRRGGGGPADADGDDGGGSGDGHRQSELPEDRPPAAAAAEEVCEQRAAETAVPEREGRRVAERRAAISETLEESLTIEDRHIFGSLTRGTLVGPLDEDSDTDVMYVLDEDTHGHWVTDENGARNCLQAIRRHLQDDPRYDDADVAVDRNVVAVQFDEFTVEVAPAFRRDGAYVIPDTYSEGRSWVRTDPRQYKRQFEAVDRNRNGRVRQLARLAKAYNEATGERVASYHMEVMAYECARTRPQGDVPMDELVDAFFEQLPQRLSAGTYDPATDKRIDAGMPDEERAAAIDDAKAARETIRRARKHKEAGDEAAVERLYRQVLEGDVDE